MKKKIFLVTLLGCFVFQPIEASAANLTLSFPEVQTQKYDISPLKDIIKWRYKSKNGKIYKRQYNYSKEKWVGKWQRV